MVSQGDGEVGAKKLTYEVLDIISKVHSTVNQIAAPVSVRVELNPE
jgi:hypothetical protein